MNLMFQFSQSFGSQELERDDDCVSCVEFDEHGEYLAIGDHAGRVCIMRERHVTSHQSSPRSHPRNVPFSYDFLTEFQSHHAESDYLTSAEVPERINCIQWIRRQRSGLFLLSSNEANVRLWKIVPEAARARYVHRHTLQQLKQQRQQRWQQQRQHLRRGVTHLRYTDCVSDSDDDASHHVDDQAAADGEDADTDHEEDCSCEHDLGRTARTARTSIPPSPSIRATDHGCWAGLTAGKHALGPSSPSSSNGRHRERSPATREVEEYELIDGYCSSDDEHVSSYRAGCGTAKGLIDRDSPRSSRRNRSRFPTSSSHACTADNAVRRSCRRLSIGSLAASRSHLNHPQHQPRQQPIWPGFDAMRDIESRRDVWSTECTLVRQFGPLERRALPIHSLSTCADGDLWLSADDLNVHIWSLERPDVTFNVVNLAADCASSSLSMPSSSSVPDSPSLWSKATSMLLPLSPLSPAIAYPTWSTSGPATLVSPTNAHHAYGKPSVQAARITCAKYHPRRDHELAYATTSGHVCIVDHRVRALGDQAALVLRAGADRPRARLFRSAVEDAAASVAHFSFVRDCPHAILSRDFFALRMWDERSAAAPVAVYPIGEPLRELSADLYAHDCMSERFHCSSSSDGSRFTTGSFNDRALVVDANSRMTALIEGTNDAAMCSAEGAEWNISSLDLNKSALFVRYHPLADVVVVACESQVRVHQLMPPGQIEGNCDDGDAQDCLVYQSDGGWQRQQQQQRVMFAEQQEVKQAAGADDAIAIEQQHDWATLARSAPRTPSQSYAMRSGGEIADEGEGDDDDDDCDRREVCETGASTDDAASPERMSKREENDGKKDSVTMARSPRSSSNSSSSSSSSSDSCSACAPRARPLSSSLSGATKAKKETQEKEEVLVDTARVQCSESLDDDAEYDEGDKQVLKQASVLECSGIMSWTTSA